MLWFVTTESRQNPDTAWGEEGCDFWLACALDPDALRQMFEDEYTRIVDIDDNIHEKVIIQYNGLVKLGTP